MSDEQKPSAEQIELRDIALEILRRRAWGDLEADVGCARRLLERALLATRDYRLRWHPEGLTTTEWLCRSAWEIDPFIPEEEVEWLDDRRRVIYLTGVIYDLAIALGYHSHIHTAAAGEPADGKLGDIEPSSPVGLLDELARTFGRANDLP